MSLLAHTSFSLHLFDGAQSSRTELDHQGAWSSRTDSCSYLDLQFYVSHNDFVLNEGEASPPAATEEEWDRSVRTVDLTMDFSIGRLQRSTIIFSSEPTLIQIKKKKNYLVELLEKRACLFGNSLSTSCFVFFFFCLTCTFNQLG